MIINTLRLFIKLFSFICHLCRNKLYICMVAMSLPQKLIKMNAVTTYQELKKALGTDGQCSGTQCGWIIFNGQKMYVRKHWSYSGGFPVYEDENMNKSIGELFGGKDYFEYTINGVPQLHNGWQPMLDSKLEMRNEN